MSEEIKEILDYLKIENGTIGSELSYEETHLLLDYITNLQEENEMYKKELEKAIEYITDNFTNIDGEIWHSDIQKIYDLLNGVDEEWIEK